MPRPSVNFYDTKLSIQEDLLLCLDLLISVITKRSSAKLISIQNNYVVIAQAKHEYAILALVFCGCKYQYCKDPLVTLQHD